MTLSWLLTNLIAALLLPPLSLLIVGGAGLLLLPSRPRLGRGLLMLSLSALWLLSTPIAARLFLDSLSPAPHALHSRDAGAIVILGGGRSRNSVEYGGDTVNPYTQERLRYGARLAREFRKPVLVTGGAPGGETVSEAQIMAVVLRNEYGVPVRWLEKRARNTRENALFTADILGKAGIRRIYLVTHAWHLARAAPEFRRAGLTVIPAGTGYRMDGDLEFFDFIPSASALLNSYLATHEWIGLLWYRLRD
ncbi:MAG TPA: YdcF family protein [Thiobacillaceae bacterium]|nr:YdcF family protein [Thiobacillaceae bacterium]HNU63274.1 YdcF family protein [Thiobacillaceae bacterium]